MKEIIETLAALVSQYSTPLAYTGAILMFVGCLALVAWVVTHRGTGILRLSGRLLVLLGGLFLALQVAAMVIGAEASANFEGAWVAMNPKPFWLVGLVLFIPGFVLRLVGAVRPVRPMR
jgi:hypothetical protein